MKILLIRHGDPDYKNDSLTPKGFREAALLADRLTEVPVREYYCSPLGRAKDTAAPTMKRLGRSAAICDWLQEFPTLIADPRTGKPRIPWDLFPKDWTKHPLLYDKDHWFNDPLYRDSDVREQYRKVANGLDEVIAANGYRRDGMLYCAERSNNDTLVFFCHLGVSCVMLSHLLGVAAPTLWQGAFLAPTSVTTLVTEEREKGTVCFRCRCLGDTNHLSHGGEPVSDSGMFEEVWKG